jgi:hypothetical protein
MARKKRRPPYTAAMKAAADASAKTGMTYEPGTTADGQAILNPRPDRPGASQVDLQSERNRISDPGTVEEAMKRKKGHPAFGG